MDIFYSDKAILDLKSLPRVEQKRIAVKMRFYAGVSDPLKFVERLTDLKLGQFRFRVGHYRIVFDVMDNKIFILKIARRDKVYK